MAINEAVNIDIDVNGVNTVKQAADAYEDLGDAVSQTQLEAERLAQQFGINDKRTQAAIKVAGRYKQELEELDMAIDSSRGGSQGLFRATQGVAAGFELAAGATALFGSESEELEKALLQVQGAMAFSQGIADLNEFGGDVVKLASNIKGKLVLAFTTLKGAIAATGLGALVIGITIAIQKVSEYNSAIEKTIDDELELARVRREESLESLDRAEAAFRRTTEIRILTAKRDGASQQELRDLEIRLLKERRTALREFAFQEGTTFAERARALEQYNAINDTITKKVLERQIEINIANKEATKILNENTEAIRKNNEEMQKLIDNQNELKGQTIETVTETGKATMRTTTVTLGYVETQQKSTFDRLKLFVGAYGEDIKNSLSEVLKVSTAFTDNMTAKATKDYENRINKLKELGYTEEEISNMRDKELEKIDERGRRAFEIQKRLRYAQTLISSIEGTQNAYTTAQESPITAILPVYPLIQAGLAAAFGIAQLQQISQSSYESKIKPRTSGSSGASSSAASVPRFQAPLAKLPGTEDFTGQNRVYVTEADISSTQNKVKVTEGISTVK